MRKIAVRSLGTALASWLVLLGASGASAEDSPRTTDESGLKEWELEIAPYGWVPALDIKTREPVLGQRHFNVSMSDVLSNLDIAAMGRVTGRWQRVVGVVDVFWSVLKEDNTSTVGPLRVDVDTEQTMVLAQALVGYRLFRQPGGFPGLTGKAGPGDPRELAFDFLAGINYTYLENQFEPSFLLPEANFQRHLETDSDWVAPTLGIRIQNDFTERFRFENLTNVGGFGVGDAADISWVITTLLSYRFTDHFLVTAGHRAVIIQGDNIDVSMSGPMIGIGVRF